jgi:hypothetical protein
MLITNGKHLKKHHLEKISKELFFNLLLSLTMENLLEFVVYGFLNIYTLNTSTNGEILGLMISLFCIFSAVIFLPISLLWAIFSKNES